MVMMVPAVTRPRIVAERPTSVRTRPIPGIVENPGIVIRRIESPHGETFGRQQEGLEHSWPNLGFAKARDIGACDHVIDADIVQVANNQGVRNAQAAQCNQIVRQQFPSVFELRKKRGRNTEVMELRDFVFIVRRTTAEDENE